MSQVFYPFYYLLTSHLQPGSGLGKQGQGMAAPVAVDIRGKRTGLGVDEAKREREVQQLQEAEAHQV